MITYQLYSTVIGGTTANAATTINENPQISFLFDPNNSDYQNFKTEIDDDTAQLKTIDGTLMSPEAAKAYVATLP
jgi:sugar/nucleoside kinase (ribokinase family)